MVDRYTQSEDLKWKEGIGKEGKAIKLPGRKEAISLVSGQVARNYSKRIVPHWVSSSRVLIDIQNPEGAKAMSYAMDNNWEKAGQIFALLTHSTNSKIAGSACHNYAVSQEMMGELEQAITWSEKSHKLLKAGTGEKISREYGEILYQRKQKTETLNILLKKQ